VDPTSQRQGAAGGGGGLHWAAMALGCGLLAMKNDTRRGEGKKTGWSLGARPLVELGCGGVWRGKFRVLRWTSDAGLQTQLGRKRKRERLGKKKACLFWKGIKQMKFKFEFRQTNSLHHECNKHQAIYLI
jgi:hypothetical protein